MLNNEREREARRQGDKEIEGDLKEDGWLGGFRVPTYLDLGS